MRDVGGRRSSSSATAPPEPSIGDRILRIAADDGHARAWLYDRFAPRLYRRLRARYGRFDGLDPDELLHDAFVFYYKHDARVLRGFLERADPGERTESQLEGYLWDLACGIASNRLRSLKRHRTAPFPEAEPVSRQATPERIHIARDALLRLVACLKSSGSRVYLYYKLRFVDGLSPLEITEATGWSRKSTYKLKTSLNAVVERCARRLRLS